MILLDTNVVSELMRPEPHASVQAWLRAQGVLRLYLSSITVAEVLYGLYILPEGRRRRELEDRFLRFVSRGFEQRILTFGEAAARQYAEVMAHRKRVGRPMSLPDAQIAGIARVHRCPVATRNVSDFENCALQVVNPFE